MEDELAELRQQLQRHKSSIAPCDLLRQFLKASREARIRNPEEVATYGSQLLQHYKHKLAEEELWLLHEQVSVALMECSNLAAALPLVKAVLIKFPDSIRAQRLQGMYYEAINKTERAEHFYNAILEAKPHNELIPKRLAALHRSQGQVTDAIDVLRTYLDHHMNDKDAWEELADCYLEAVMYRQAAFCLEEVLSMGVLVPQSLIRYADVLATIGGPAQLKAARAYYSKALQVTGGRSARALYGLIFVANQMPDKEAASSSPAAQELPAAAAEALVKLYSQQAPDKLPVVQQALQKYL